MIRTLMLCLVGLFTFSTVTVQAGEINVKSLPGKIFFRGFRKMQEFKGSGAAQQLYVINTNGSGQQKLLPSFGSIWDLASYPRIKKLSFISNSENKAQDGTFILDISEPWATDQLQLRLARALPENFPVKFSGPIAFSPDGSLVAGAYGELQIADVKTGAVNVVKGQFMPEGGLPAWSPVGQKIVLVGCLFNDKYSNAFELFIVDKNGKDLRQLTNLPRHISWWRIFLTPSTEQPKHKEQHKSYDPKWSPDGQWIVFGSFEDIYKVRPDGSNLIPFLNQVWYNSLIPSTEVRHGTYT